MTPQEKAEELFKKAKDCQWSDAEYGMDDTTAKQCALICVDQIILEQCKSSELKDPRYQDERLMYWNQVKQEIDKL